MAELRRRRRRTLVFALTIAAAVVALVVATGAPSNRPLAGGVAVDSGAFANGACMLFAPTAGDRHRTVFLDAGHGGIDPGGVGETTAGKVINEAAETLPVELDAMAILRAQGFSVVVSRTRASTVLRLSPIDHSGRVLTLSGAHDDVAARDVCANRAKADVLVGIYYDAGASASDAGSLTAYDADRPFSSANLRLATLIQRTVVAAMDKQGWSIPDDGVQTDADLGSLVGDTGDGGLAGAAARYDHLLVLGPAESGFFTTPSSMPGSVIEPLYLTDPYEGSIADSAHDQRVIAQGIATAVTEYFAGGKLTPARGTS
jgi:N-acetylmuramoyl-L-alanine amidase